MKKSRILYSSAEVRKTIIEIFSSCTGRRVAVTAFVGKGAEAYLPKPEGLELICWPKAGGTNPYVLRKLMERGADVLFVDSLHMKIYWTEDKGAVITSANLSTNALGAGNLREIGVYVPSDQLDIKKVLYSLKKRPVTSQELSRLDRQHHEYQKVTRDTRKKTQGVTFKEWYELPFRPKWKIGWYDIEGDFSKPAKEIAKEEYNVRTPNEFLACQQNAYRKYDWVLSFDLEKQTPSFVRWMSVDYIVRVPRSEKKAYCSGYPYQAVQVWSLRHYPEPPFRVEPRFRSAFKKALREFGPDEIKERDMVKPTNKLIDLIISNY
jgi:hypothetical protein